MPLYFIWPNIVQPNFPTAPLWRRLLALVYDAFLLFAIAAMCTFVFIMIKGGIVGFEHLKSAKAGRIGGLPLFIFILLSWCSFYYWFWTRNGQTLGMQTWRLRVEQLDGKNINARQALLRMLIAPLSIICFGIGYLYCLVGQQRCWQDIVSNTRVVVLPKP